jgi:hypothetical protein
VISLKSGAGAERMSIRPHLARRVGKEPASVRGYLHNEKEQ